MAQPDGERVQVHLFGVEYFILAWMAGMLAAYLELWTFSVIILATALMAFLMVGCKRYRSLCIVLAAGMLLGGVRFWIYDRTVRQPLWSLDGESRICSGTVRQVRFYARDTVRYTLRVRLDGHTSLVDWYTDAEGTIYELGDQITLDAKLQRAVQNNGMKDMNQESSGKYLRVTKAELLSYQPVATGSVRRIIRRYRDLIQDRIQLHMKPEGAAILCGMLFGDRTSLSEESANALNRIGIGHIMTVSGLHVMFFCALLMRLLKALHTPAKLSFVLQAVMLMLFTMLVDAAPSVYRAVSMILLYQLSELFGRYGSSRRSLCLTMFCFTLFVPYLICSASFWMSVAGTAGIGLFAPYMSEHITGRLASFRKSICGLFCVSMAVFPVSVVFFGEGSVMSPLWNFLFLPIATVSLYLGFFYLLSGGLAGFLLYPAQFLCELLSRFSVFAAKFRYTSLRVASPMVRLVIVFEAITVMVLLILHFKEKTIVRTVIVCVMSLALLIPLASYQSRNQLRVAVYGVNAPQAIVLSNNHTAVVVDINGNRKNAKFVQTYLTEQNISDVSTIFVPNINTAANYSRKLEELTVSHWQMQDSLGWSEHELLFGGLTPEITGDTPCVYSYQEARLEVNGGSSVLYWYGQQIDLSLCLNSVLTMDCSARSHSVRQTAF